MVVNWPIPNGPEASRYKCGCRNSSGVACNAHRQMLPGHHEKYVKMGSGPKCASVSYKVVNTSMSSNVEFSGGRAEDGHRGIVHETGRDGEGRYRADERA